MAGVVSTWRRLIGWAQLLTYDEHARYADFNHRVLMARVERQGRPTGDVKKKVSDGGNRD